MAQITWLLDYPLIPPSEVGAARPHQPRGGDHMWLVTLQRCRMWGFAESARSLHLKLCTTSSESRFVLMLLSPESDFTIVAFECHKWFLAA